MAKVSSDFGLSGGTGIIEGLRAVLKGSEPDLWASSKCRRRFKDPREGLAKEETKASSGFERLVDPFGLFEAVVSITVLESTL